MSRIAQGVPREVSLNSLTPIEIEAILYNTDSRMSRYFFLGYWQRGKYMG